MKYFKWPLIFLAMLYFHCNYVSVFTVTSISDVLYTYSGCNAMVLHFGLYMGFICIMNMGQAQHLNSEFLIRMNRSTFIKSFLKTSIINSLIFITLLYLSGSVVLIYYLGIEYYMFEAAYIPILFALIIYTIIYTIVSIVWMFLLIYLKKNILSTVLTMILSILTYALFRQQLSNIAFFEMFYEGDGALFAFVQSFIVAMIILIILVTILFEVFQRRDIIYEEKL